MDIITITEKLILSFFIVVFSVLTLAFHIQYMFSRISIRVTSPAYFNVSEERMGVHNPRTWPSCIYPAGRSARHSVTFSICLPDSKLPCQSVSQPDRQLIQNVISLFGFA